MRTASTRSLGFTLAAFLSTILAAACIRPGAYVELPERVASTRWRPLTIGEKEALRRRLAEEEVPFLEDFLEDARVPAAETPYLPWSKPWSFRGAEVQCEFRVIRYRRGRGDSTLPASFTLMRDPLVEDKGIAGKKTAPEAAPASVGRVRYRWDLYVIDVRATRHCLFYERQLDRHERRHVLYAEELIRKLQKDGMDLVSRLLGPVEPREGGAEGARPGDVDASRGDAGGGRSSDSRRSYLAGAAARFAADFPTLRRRYWTPSAEEKRVDRETMEITESDRQDIEENCLAEPGAKTNR